MNKNRIELQKNYFEQKAEEIENKIHENWFADNFTTNRDKRKALINIGIKEVARDMRHQIVDELISLDIPYLVLREDAMDKITNTIMNFEPKLKGE